MELGQITDQIILMFILMMVGVLINKLGFMHPDTSNDLTNILLYVVSPCLIIGAFEQTYSAALMKKLVWVTVGIVIIYIIEIIITKFAFSQIKSENLKRIAKYGSIYSNAGFMGVPLASALFGNNGVFFAVASLAAFNLFSWTHGISLFKQTSETTSLQTKLKDSIINPNIIAIAVGLIMFSFSIKVPGTLNIAIKDISLINTPVSMIVIGNSLANIKVNRELFDWHIWLSILFRNLLFPIIAILILKSMGITGIPLFTTVLMTACPVAGVVVLFTLQSDGDTSPAISLMSLSTIICLVTIPLIFTIINII
ncbi:AEC family transporter [Lactobacillaceae bacterium Scapto_B20]